jgi:hypothetical protein
VSDSDTTILWTIYNQFKIRAKQRPSQAKEAKLHMQKIGRCNQNPAFFSDKFNLSRSIFPQRGHQKTNLFPNKTQYLLFKIAFIRNIFSPKQH